MARKTMGGWPRKHRMERKNDGDGKRRQASGLGERWMSTLVKDCSKDKWHMNLDKGELMMSYVNLIISSAPPTPKIWGWTVH